MEVRIALLADAANLSQEGKLNILGEFNTIFAATVPVVWPLMQLVVKIEATSGEGPNQHVGIRVLDEDGQRAGPDIEADVVFGKPLTAGQPFVGQFIIGVVNAAFPKYGTYTFEILVGGLSLRAVPLHILPASERKPPGRP